MINIYLKNYNKSHPIYELVKVLFETSDINFLDELRFNIDGYLIILDLDSNVVNSKIYLNNDLISENNIDNIENMNIKRPFDKKIGIAVKKSIYMAAKQIKNISAPWGILTGIRPSKVVHDLREKNIGNDEIIEILTEEYLLDIKKAQLLVEITSLQKKHIYPINKDNYSLYVSIPFCPSRCVYCSFPSYSTFKWGHFIDSYTNSLIEEIKELGSFMNDKILKTIYIGGGTPTAIPNENLEMIIKAIYKYFDISKILEFTVEAGRVDTINKEVLEMLKRNKIDRISINPQTMNDDTLKLMNRSHSKEEIKEIFNQAKKIGFNSINMDLIVGLPKENEKDIKNTMEIIKTLNPDNLTVHTLTIKKSSKLNKELDKYEIKKENNLENMLDITREYSKGMNMRPYYMYRQKQILGNFENIGYAKKNKECIYNIFMMEERQTVIGLGAGSVSKIFDSKTNKIHRMPNVVNLNEYVKNTQKMNREKMKALKQMLTENF